MLLLFNFNFHRFVCLCIILFISLLFKFSVFFLLFFTRKVQHSMLLLFNLNFHRFICLCITLTCYVLCIFLSFVTDRETVIIVVLFFITNTHCFCSLHKQIYIYVGLYIIFKLKCCVVC